MMSHDIYIGVDLGTTVLKAAAYEDKTGRCLALPNGSTKPTTVDCGDGTSGRLVWVMMPWFSSETAQKGYGFNHSSGSCIYNTPVTVYVTLSILDTRVTCGTFLSSRWKVIP